MEINIMSLVDHTVLKPYYGVQRVRQVVEEASRFGCYAVCVNPVYVRYVRELVDEGGLSLRVCAVIDFPFGASGTEAREQMIVRASYDGADEVDVVAPITMVKSGRWEYVRRDLGRLVRAAHGEGLRIKVIVEDAYTTLDEKRRLYSIVVESGADFIKTSTGFEDSEYASQLGNRTGAQAENVRLMREVIDSYGSSVGIKVAGGIRSVRQALELLEASGRQPRPDSFRIGTSAAALLWQEVMKGRQPP